MPLSSAAQSFLNLVAESSRGLQRTAHHDAVGSWRSYTLQANEEFWRDLAQCLGIELEPSEAFDVAISRAIRLEGDDGVAMADYIRKCQDAKD